jgi:hypothetical protein
MWVEFPSCLALGCIALSGSYIFDRDCPLAPENNVHTTIDATCDTALGSMAGIGEPTDTQTTQTYSNTLSEMTEACGGTTLSGSYSATYTLSEPILTSELVDALIVAAPGRGGSVDDEATEAVYWLFSDESGGLYKALSYWFEPDPTNPITTDHVTIGWEVAVYEADPSGAPGAELSRVSHSATDPWLTTYDIEPGVGVGPSFYRRHRIENITLFCYDDP